MLIDKLKYNKLYVSGLKASVDWIAGGNFDGYLFKNNLYFNQENNKVIRTITIIDDSKFDGKLNIKEQIGIFSETDKKTITCVFAEYEMRGKILGKNDEFIAFSNSYTNPIFNHSDCYEVIL